MIDFRNSPNLIRSPFLILVLYCTLLSCKEQEATTSDIHDKIIVINATPNTDLRILVDGNFQSHNMGLNFVNDQLEILEFGETELSGNYSLGSHNEVILFQSGKAPTTISNINWTEEEDIVEIEMNEMVEIPIVFWVLMEVEVEDIEWMVQEANKQFDFNRMGIKLVDLRIVDRTDIENRDQLTGWLGTPDPSDIELIGNDSQALNVSIIDNIALDNQFFSGIWIGSGKFVGLIAPDARRESNQQPWLLMHEIGHGLGLGHAQDVGLGAGNVMSSGRYTPNLERFGFSAGQVFRAHTHRSQILTDLRLGELTVRNCQETLEATDNCPGIAQSFFKN